jgi:hypothetical protein
MTRIAATDSPLLAAVVVLVVDDELLLEHPASNSTGNEMTAKRVRRMTGY